jgi:hypothetical protein
MNTLRRLRLVALLLFVDAILLVAAYVLYQSGGASWFAASVFVLMAVLATAFVVTAVSPPRRRLVARADRGGIGMSNSPVIAGLLVALLVGFLLFPVSLAVAWATSGDRPITAAGPLVLLAIAVVGAVPVLVGLLRGRYQLGGLLLTPREVVYESLLRRHSLPWDHISAVVAPTTTARLELRASQRPVTTGPRLRAGEQPITPDRLEQLNVPTGLLRTDVRALQELLEFYRTHPRDRHELADGTALTRRHEGVRR